MSKSKIFLTQLSKIMSKDYIIIDLSKKFIAILKSKRDELI